jgi:hypothetical protein
MIMTAQITTSHGTFTGRTAQSIVRREYGRTARIVWSADRNNPAAGMIVRRDRYGTHVLATLYAAEGAIETDHRGWPV